GEVFAVLFLREGQRLARERQVPAVSREIFAGREKEKTAPQPYQHHHHDGQEEHLAAGGRGAVPVPEARPPRLPRPATGATPGPAGHRSLATPTRFRPRSHRSAPDHIRFPAILLAERHALPPRIRAARPAVLRAHDAVQPARLVANAHTVAHALEFRREPLE